MPLTFSGYVERLLDALEVPVDPGRDGLNEQTGLFDELGLSSLHAFQLIVFSEAISNLLIPPDSLPEIFTLGDAYRYYLECCQGAL